MKEAKFIEKLRGLKSCEEGLKYAESFGSLQKAWDACERGDWMLWLLGKLSGPPESESRKELVLIACKCARTALKYVEKGDEKRPLKAIQTAEKWAKGAATIEEVREASTASYSAYASYSVYAAYSAYAASSAASVASYSVYAAYAASVASCAAYAASVASSAAIQKKCADIVRKMHPKAPRLMTKKDEEAMK